MDRRTRFKKRRSEIKDKKEKYSHSALVPISGRLDESSTVFKGVSTGTATLFAAAVAAAAAAAFSFSLS